MTEEAGTRGRDGLPGPGGAAADADAAGRGRGWPRRVVAGLLLAAGVLVVAAGALLAVLYLMDRRVEPPAVPTPRPVGVQPALTELPASVLELPVWIGVHRVEDALEELVPRRFGDMRDRRAHPANPNLQFAFQADRDDLDLEIRGDTLRLTAVFAYRGRVWAPSPLGGELTAACGDDPGEPAPRARVVLSSPMELEPRWSFRSRSRVETVEPLTGRDRDRCRMRVMNFELDVTDLVMETVRGSLEEETRELDAALAGFDLRSRAELPWLVLRTPLIIGDRMWLVLDPRQVRYGGWRVVAAGDGERPAFHVDLGLLLRPRLVLGDSPDVEDVPLPDLRTEFRGEAPTGAAGAATAVSGAAGGADERTPSRDGPSILYLEGSLEYGDLSRLLTRQAEGFRFEAAGRTVGVREVEIAARQDGRLAAAITLAGGIDGRLTLTGTPVLDPEAEEILVPDLELSVETGNLLLRAAVWAARTVYPRRIRHHARVSVEEALRDTRETASRQLDRHLLPGVRLEGELESLEPLILVAGPEALVLRARAGATARVRAEDE